MDEQSSTFNKLEIIQSKLQDYEPTVTESMIIAGEARYLSWDFTHVNIPQLDLLQITDVQFGHKQCKVSKLQEYVDWVLDQPQRYVVLGGDLVDAGHVQSKGSPFEQIGDPQEEAWSFCDIIAPIRHRVLGYVGGNHERRSIPTFGDLGKTIATILKVPYSPGKQHLDITFGDHKPFKISMHHSGSGGGGTVGALANSLGRLMSQGDSQLYLCGHLHRAMVLTDFREYRNGAGEMKLQKVVGARGSSFLGHYGTYSEIIMGTSPQAVMMPLVTIEKNGHWSVNTK
jgi:hypothetical protein